MNKDFVMTDQVVYLIQLGNAWLLKDVLYPSKKAAIESLKQYPLADLQNVSIRKFQVYVKELGCDES